MAVLGIQFIFTIIMFSFLQKLLPIFSFGRWMLSRKLVRYLHPTDEELRQLSGITKKAGKNKTERHQDFRKVLSKSKQASFNIPRNLPIQLDTAKVEPVDLIPLHYYSEYQWLTDFSLCALIVFTVTELYCTITSQHIQFNTSVIWCMLGVIFSIHVLVSQTSDYLHTDEGGEKVLLFTFGFFYLVMGMAVLIVGEDILEFGLEAGYKNFSMSAAEFLKRQEVLSYGMVSQLTFKIFLVIFCTILGMLLTYPGLRSARLYIDSLKYYKEDIFLQVLLHMNFMFPAVLLLLWVKPVGQNILCGVGGSLSQGYMVELQFETFRLVFILLSCCMRFGLLRLFMQSHLNLAHAKVERIKKESGRIDSLELQKKVAHVFYYLCVVAIQYLAPTFLLLFLTLLLKVMGDYSWADLFGESFTNNFSSYQHQTFINDSVPTATTEMPTTMFEGPSYLAVTVGDLHSIFTVVWYRGLLSFMLWWVSAVWFTSALFGVLYYSNNADN